MNPLAKLIRARIADLGIGRTELMQGLGWLNTTRGLRRLDACLATGRPESHLLKGLPGALGLDPAEVEAAAAATRRQIAGAEEAAARERFRPFIEVLTRTPDGVYIPVFIHVFFGHRRRLALPAGFEELRPAQQVRQAVRIVRRHFRESGGDIPVWGAIVGYRLQRTFDHAVVLNTDGTVREGFERNTSGRAPAVQIRGRSIPANLFRHGASQKT